MENENIRVLIVDDETMVSKMLKSFLELYDFSVEVAGTATEALDYISRMDFTAAIVDMRLPDMDGNELILKAYKMKPGIKYFVHTGSLEYNITEELKEIGLEQDSILRKPVSDMTVIYNAIREYADKK